MHSYPIHVFAHVAYESAPKRNLDRFIRFCTVHLVSNTQTERQTHEPRNVRHVLVIAASARCSLVVRCIIAFRASRIVPAKAKFQILCAVVWARTSS